MRTWTSKWLIKVLKMRADSVSSWTLQIPIWHCSGHPLMQMARAAICVFISEAIKCVISGGWPLEEQLKHSSNPETEVCLLCTICKTQRAELFCRLLSLWCQNSSLSAGFTELSSDQKNWGQLKKLVGFWRARWRQQSCALLPQIM